MCTGVKMINIELFGTTGLMQENARVVLYWVQMINLENARAVVYWVQIPFCLIIYWRGVTHPVPSSPGLTFIFLSWGEKLVFCVSMMMHLAEMNSFEWHMMKMIRSCCTLVFNVDFSMHPGIFEVFFPLVKDQNLPLYMIYY